MNILLTMNAPLSSEAMATFFEGLKVLAYGMSATIGVLFFFYLIVKLLIKFFPEKE